MDYAQKGTRLQICERRVGMTPIEKNNVTFTAYEFDNKSEALQYACASGQGRAITVNGRTLVVSDSDIDCLAARGVEFAFVVDAPCPSGEYTIMTIPVN